jgi:hypothetical protein
LLATDTGLSYGVQPLKLGIGVQTFRPLEIGLLPTRFDFQANGGEMLTAETIGRIRRTATGSYRKSPLPGTPSPDKLTLVWHLRHFRPAHSRLLKAGNVCYRGCNGRARPDEAALLIGASVTQ